MGVSLGGYAGASAGGSSSSTNTNTNTSGTSTDLFSPEQASLRVALGQFFQQLVPGLSSGRLTPDVAAQKTGAADTINDNFAASGDALQKNLAKRGFAGSGESGKAALSTELAREGALGANESAAASTQLGQNNGSLLAALNYAFTKLGSSTAATGSESTTGNASQWGTQTGFGASGKLP